MTLSRTLTIGGLIAVLLATSACHRHFRHHHRHHLGAATEMPAVLPQAPGKALSEAG